MNRLLLTGLLTAALSASLPEHARADVKLPSVLGSHMVLQRDKPLTIWGTAEAGEEVKVAIGKKSVSTKADDKGNWKVSLPAMKADGKAHTVTITGKNKIELKDVLIGEVWVGSGQSNMEWSMTRTQGAKKAIATADHPKIRLFHVPRVEKEAPARDVKAKWEVCSPKTVGRFSGVLYYFGLRLHEELKVPVGLIHSSWGGSAIEPWTIAGKISGRKYNGMIAPLMPFAVRGVVWYQGETNVFHKNGLKYRDKMEALIKGWRATWGKDMPFYFVQIAPWEGGRGGYPAGELPALWEAQVASLKIPHTGMAVTTDLVDNIRDIHPQNKKDVGNRLALWALAKNYGKKDLVYSGPLYKSMKIEDGKVRLTFAHVGGGLKSRDGKALTEFQIAGKDGKFVPAEAVIDGKTVVVSAKAVKEPTQVRFGWRKIANPNLMNKEGLPASPFQTLNWTGGTGE
jgi:sialate O-acetylesterase